MAVATVVAVVVVVAVVAVLVAVVEDARIVAMHHCSAWDPIQLLLQLALDLATAPPSSLANRKNPWQQLHEILRDI